ncbi:hypothetical protein FD754_018389, partial [Muntiacus muntjak]
HSTPPSAYGSVKAYTNFDAERDALNIETAIKTKACTSGVAPSLDPWTHCDDCGDACDSPHSFPTLDKALLYMQSL